MRTKRDFLNMTDLKTEEIFGILSRAGDYKTGRGADQSAVLRHKTVAMIFKKPSTRTRVSFDVAIAKLGGHSLALSGAELQMGRGETTEDTAKVLSRYVDAIVIRTNQHSEVVDLATGGDIPVINALTDNFHPCQALADLLTIYEKRSKLSGVRLAYVGDGNNVCHSLILAAAKVGLDLRVACPTGYEPKADVLKLAEAHRERPGSISITNDPAEAAAEADFIYTDVWTSMGQDAESEERRRKFAGFQVNAALVAKAKKNVQIMHCLPAHRGEEISAEVMDSPRSIVFDQAENRLHAQAALLAFLIEESGSND